MCKDAGVCLVCQNLVFIGGQKELGNCLKFISGSFGCVVGRTMDDCQLIAGLTFEDMHRQTSSIMTLCDTLFL